MDAPTASWRCAAMVALGVLLADPGRAQPFQLVSVPDPGTSPSATSGGDSGAPILSSDGRFVLFAGTANNLVPLAATNPLPVLFPARLNAYVRDRTNATTTLLSVNLSGTGGGNGDSFPAGISTDGRYALFQSSASDLVFGDTNNAADIFVRDLVAGTTMLVSIATNGACADGPSRGAKMTPDGRFVVFVSEADNLVPDDTNRVPDVFVRDLQAGTTTLVSVGARAQYHALPGLRLDTVDAPEITPDGRYVGFVSTLTNLVPGVTNVGDVYVRDLMAGATTWASVDARSTLLAATGVTNGAAYNLVLSEDGQFVAYEAAAVGYGPGLGPGMILRYSMATGLSDVVSTNASVTTLPYQEVQSLDMTPDGRFIVFVGNANNSIGGTNTAIYSWDASSAMTALVSSDLGNQAPTNALSDCPRIDAGGTIVAFLSTATGLVTNAVGSDYHLYVRNLVTGTTTLVDADTNATGLGQSPGAFDLSADGRSIAFDAPNPAMVANDANHDVDVFVRNLQTSVLELASPAAPTLLSHLPDGPSTLSRWSLSATARFVAFSSEADDLVPNDTNGFRDIFLRDTLYGTNALVSVSAAGGQADGPSLEPAISADGRYVAFTSSADNLVATDTNKATDIFVRNVIQGTTTLVSISTNGVSTGAGASYSPSISTDGRYVLFRSTAWDLVATNLTAGYEYIFVRDVQAQTTYLLGTGTYAGQVFPASMTPDGRYVALFVPLGGGSGGLVVWDSQSATTVSTGYAESGAFAVSISPGGNRIAYATQAGIRCVDLAANTNSTIASGSPGSYPGLQFSSDDRFLAYTTFRAVLPSDSNGLFDVYLYDFAGNTNVLVSSAFHAPTSGNGSSDTPVISPDARFVAYRSAATNLVSSDTNGAPDLFLFDRLYGTTTLLTVSAAANTAADSRSLAPVFSSDGQTLVFQSWSSDLLPPDSNQSSDIFAYSLYSSSTIPLFRAQILSSPGQGSWITWPTLPGKAYHVQFKNELTDAVWQEVTSGVSVEGSQGYFVDLNPSANHRFFRIVGL